MDGNEAAGINQEGTDLLTSGMGAEDNQSQDSGSGSDINQKNAGQEEQQNTGGEIKPWQKQLKSDLQGNASLDKFDGFDSLARSYMELEGKMGNSISIPGEDATDEEKAAYLGKLRGLDKAEDYQVKYKEDLPESLKESFSTSETKLRETMFNAGLTQKQADSMLDWMQDQMLIGTEAAKQFRKEQQETAAATMKSEWGGNYDTNITIMTNGLRKLAGNDDGFIKKLTETGLVNEPALARIFLNVGKLVSEDTLIDGTPPGDDFDPEKHVLFT